MIASLSSAFRPLSMAPPRPCSLSPSVPELPIRPTQHHSSQVDCHGKWKVCYRCDTYKSTLVGRHTFAPRMIKRSWQLSLHFWSIVATAWSLSIMRVRYTALGCLAQYIALRLLPHTWRGRGLAGSCESLTCGLVYIFAAFFVRYRLLLLVRRDAAMPTDLLFASFFFATVSVDGTDAFGKDFASAIQIHTSAADLQNRLCVIGHILAGGQGSCGIKTKAIKRRGLLVHCLIQCQAFNLLLPALYPYYRWLIMPSSNQPCTSRWLRQWSS